MVKCKSFSSLLLVGGHFRVKKWQCTTGVKLILWKSAYRPAVADKVKQRIGASCRAEPLTLTQVCRQFAGLWDWLSGVAADSWPCVSGVCQFSRCRDHRRSSPRFPRDRVEAHIKMGMKGLSWPVRKKLRRDRLLSLNKDKLLWIMAMPQLMHLKCISFTCAGFPAVHGAALLMREVPRVFTPAQTQNLSENCSGD